MKKKKAAPRRQVKSKPPEPKSHAEQFKSKPPATRRSGKVILSPFDPLDPSSPVYHYQQLTRLADEMSAVSGMGLEMPSERILHDLLNALCQFRSISKRGPHVSLMTLAREADKMWESLRLCENLGRLATELGACAIQSPMRTLEKKHQKSGFAIGGLRQWLRAMLRKQATPKAGDLEILIPLVSERLRKQIEVILSEDPRKNARTDEVRMVLAQQCADELCEQNAQYLARERLLRPCFDFFLALNDRELFRKAGFISEAEDQEITLLRHSKATKDARERQKRCRSKKKARTQA